MSGPIRGLHDVEGQLFAVSGNTLYQISNAGVAIPRGMIPGVGRVSMAHNQVSGGNQLIVVNGSGGYVWNTADETFQIVVDEGYPGAAVVDFVDGYLMQVEPFGRFLFHSNLADALDYNTLDRFEAETSPDKTVGMIVNHQEVWAFGERTIDVFANTGTAQGTFKNKGISISRGCIAKATPAIIDNGTAWLGDDRVVYHARGYDPVRISTRAIEVALSECSLTDIRNAFSFVWADRGHSVYYLTVPNGQTFGYDFSTGLWHRRASWHPERDISGRWMLSDLVRSNGKWIGGDYRNGKLYQLDWDYMLEGCEPLIRERVSPVAHNNGARFTVDSAELFFDTGGPETACIAFPFQPVGPQIEGEAPDGLTGEPYTFTYTTTPGTGDIVRTVLIDTTLPAGWEWDEQTATISRDETPIPITTISLKMRVYDTNGLYADHEDTFVIAQEYHLLVTGMNKPSEDPVFATAVALSPIEFSGIASSTGANLTAMTAAFHDGVWAAVRNTGARSATDDLGDWTNGTVDEEETPSFGKLVGNAQGWLTVIPNKDDGPTAYVSPPELPLAFTRTALTATFTNGFNADSRIQSAPTIFSDGTDLFMGATRSMFRASDPAGPWTTIWDEYKEAEAGRNPNQASIIGWYDIAQFEDEWYAIIEWDFRDSLKRYQVIKSSDGLENWNTFDVLVDRAAADSLKPGQFCQGAGELVAYTTDGQLWTSKNGWSAPISTGITGPGLGLPGVLTTGGRRIVFANSKFHLIDATDKYVTYDPATDEVSEPITLPIQNAFSIATDYVEPPEDE